MPAGNGPQDIDDVKSVFAIDGREVRVVRVPASRRRVRGCLTVELAGEESAAQGTLRFYRERAHLLMAITEAAAYDPAIREFWNSELDQFTAAATKRLVDEQVAGRVPKDLDAATAAEVIIWGGDRVIARHVTSNDAVGDGRVARELALMQWHGAFRRPD
jgi:hypothetical protein